MSKDAIHDQVMLELDDAFDQFKRRGAWGECECCPLPHPEAVSIPENCVNATRDDHLLSFEELFERYNLLYSRILRKEAAIPNL